MISAILSLHKVNTFLNFLLIHSKLINAKGRFYRFFRDGLRFRFFSKTASHYNRYFPLLMRLLIFLRKWKASERMFQKVNVEKKFSFVKAQKYKEEGNKKYKEEKFEAALKCYTLGLECVPPVEGFGKPSEQKKTNW